MRKPLAITLLSSLAASAAATFVPNLAEDLGADDMVIGIIGAMYALALFISNYVFGRESDVHGRVAYVKIGLGVSVIAFVIQVLTDPHFITPFLASPWFLAIARFFAGFTAGISPAALTAYVFDSKGKLGKFSSFGALGMGLGSLIAGYVAIYWGVFIISSLCFFLAFVVSLFMAPANNAKLKVPFFPRALMRRNWYVYVAFFFRHFGANTIWVIYPLFIISVGGDKFWIGVIYAINSFAQFFIMQVLDRFGDRRLLSAGLILSAATFIVISLSQSFYWLIPTQLLLASAWSCLYVGSLVFLCERNVEKATSTGILSSMTNLSTVFGSLLGGTIALYFGFLATMYVAAVLTLVGYVLFKIGVRGATRQKRPGSRRPQRR